MSSDKEIKLIAKSNTQIKFYNSNRYGDITKKIHKVLMALGATIVDQNISSDRRRPTRHDVFFDHDWLLADRMQSVVIRHYTPSGGNAALTIKLDEDKENIGSISLIDRAQFKTQITQDQARHYIQNGIRQTDLVAHFPEIDLDLDDDDVLTEKGSSFMRRSIIRFAMNGQDYSLSVDKFYFHDQSSDKYSETFLEIEVDCTDNKKVNPSLKTFIDILQCMLDVEMQPISKYQRFRDFCYSDQCEEYFFIGVDLVSYSTAHSWKQKQIVQRFHKIIKDSVPVTRTRNNSSIMISIGDGAIIAMPSDWPNIERTVLKIKAGVDKNNHHDDLRKIEFKIAVHFGSVFTFTDLNDAINVAGEGINIVSRILDRSAEGKCLLSQKAYERILDANPVDSTKFNFLGEEEFKHGVKLNIYEYDIARR